MIKCFQVLDLIDEKTIYVQVLDLIDEKMIYV